MPLQHGVWLALAVVALQGPAGIPRTWDAAEVADFELPLAVPAYTPQHVPEDYYYRLPVRPVFKSYPIYHPDREPPGYREWLAGQAPEVVFGPAERVDQPDWAAAGELVFSAPIGYNGPVGPRHVTDPAWYAEVGVPLASDGVMPYARWVIRRRGRARGRETWPARCATRACCPLGPSCPGRRGNFSVRPLHRARSGRGAAAGDPGRPAPADVRAVGRGRPRARPAAGPAAGDAGRRARRRRGSPRDERRTPGPRARSDRHPGAQVISTPRALCATAPSAT